MSKDVIVFDAELKNADTQIAAYAEELIERMQTYITVINEILKLAVQDTEISNELNDIVGEVETIKVALTVVRDGMKGECSSFVTAIDNADQFLY